MAKKNNILSMLFIVFLFVIIGTIIYTFAFGYPLSKYMMGFNDSSVKWVTSGTCSSNGLQNLSQPDCSSYFANSNYNITNADHGPPGCWLVLGDSLKGVIKQNPQFAGKGFGCWSKNQTDGKQCSPDFPCVCKS